MGVEFRSATYSGDAVQTVPAGVQPGDLLVVSMVSQNADSGYPPAPVPAGWSLLVDWGDVGRYLVYYRIADGTEPASYEFSDPMFGPRMGFMAAYSGVDTGSPAQAFATAQDFTTSLSTPSVTATGPGLTLTIGLAQGNGRGLSSSGFTQRVDEYDEVSSKYASVILGDEPLNGAGQTAPNTLSTSTSTSIVAVTVALRSLNSPPNAPTIITPVQDQAIDRGSPFTAELQASDPDPGDGTSQTYWDVWNLDANDNRTGSATRYVKTSPVTAYTFPAETFSLGRKEMKAATRDSQGAPENEADLVWSESVFFTVADAPDTPVFTDPTPGQTIGLSEYEAVISAPDVDESMWRTVADDGSGNPDVSTVLYGPVHKTSGDLRRHVFTFPVNNRVEHLQALIKDTGLWSAEWASSRNTISYTPPPEPSRALIEDPDEAEIVVNITNPAPAEGEPAVAYNNIYVTDPGKPEQRRATMLPPNQPWTYDLPVSGYLYDGSDGTNIRVEAVGTNGTKSSSS